MRPVRSHSRVAVSSECGSAHVVAKHRQPADRVGSTVALARDEDTARGARVGHRDTLGVRPSRAVGVVQGFAATPAALGGRHPVRTVAHEAEQPAVAVAHGPELPAVEGQSAQIATERVGRVGGRHCRAAGPWRRHQVTRARIEGALRRRGRRGELAGAVGAATVGRRRVRRPGVAVDQSRPLNRRAESLPPRPKMVSPDVDHEVSARGDARGRGHSVRVVLRAVLEHVAREVDRRRSGVLELDPVAGGTGIRLDLVDAHRRAAVVRRALGGCWSW